MGFTAEPHVMRTISQLWCYLPESVNVALNSANHSVLSSTNFWALFALSLFNTLMISPLQNTPLIWRFNANYITGSMILCAQNRAAFANWEALYGFFQYKRGLNLNPSFFNNCLNPVAHLHVRYLPQLASDVFFFSVCLCSLVPPWCHGKASGFRGSRNRSSPLPSSWEGVGLEPRDSLRFSMPALMVVFTFSSFSLHCEHKRKVGQLTVC